MSSPAAAQRVAHTIGTVKWVMIGAQALFAIIAVAAALTADSGTTVGLGLLSALSIGISAVVTWVLFGWFEHTLSMLSRVALNTAAPSNSSYAPMQHS